MGQTVIKSSLVPCPPQQTSPWVMTDIYVLPQASRPPLQSLMSLEAERTWVVWGEEPSQNLARAGSGAAVTSRDIKEGHLFFRLSAQNKEFLKNLRGMFNVRKDVYQNHQVQARQNHFIHSATRNWLKSFDVLLSCAVRVQEPSAEEPSSAGVSELL